MNSVMHSINNGESCIQTLAQTACLGYKQFQRIFDENIGLHPKEFLQVNRFSKASHALQTHPTITLDDLANAYGYYDKSHLIKDFKKLAGYSPSQLSSNFDPYSDYMSLFQTFFIDTDHL
jgi:Transcriptional regulator containing an amidase domain and an AraC-type DNA-binding HTH domain